MFEPFSSGYYLGRLYVQPHDGERPAMHREQHEHVSEQLYGDGTANRDDGTPADEATTPTDPAEPTYTLGIPAEERPDEGSSEADDERPLVMKIGGAHVPVHGAPGVPEQTVALPADWLAATRVKNPPTLTEVLLAKRERVDQLLKVAEDTASGRT